MSGPYVSSRSGRFAWMMQRVTAALLVPLAFVHFGMQHFTSDAVSTGLATTFRLHNPYWVAFYTIFVVCVLYHGVNGTIGIVRDYAPKPLQRGIIVVVLWALALYFGVLGIRNVVSPGHNLESAKNYYAQEGFPEGESAGNPPNFLWKPKYAFNEEVRELNLLNYYLEKHTVRTEASALSSSEIFKGGEFGENIAAGGIAFDEWALDILSEGFAAHKDKRELHRIFSSTYEFALWAVNVRKTNAAQRMKNAEQRNAEGDAKIIADAQATLNLLASTPAFDDSIH